jgi:DNA-directed RNA polymerase subunit M
MFCPKCGSLLMPRLEGTKKIMACSCGYKPKNVEAHKISEKMEKEKNIDVIDKDDYETLPKMEAECPKCGNKTAFYWLVQTRAGDEPETKFLKCERCKHTWRDYD